MGKDKKTTAKGGVDSSSEVKDLAAVVAAQAEAQAETAAAQAAQAKTLARIEALLSAQADASVKATADSGASLDKPGVTPSDADGMNDFARKLASLMGSAPPSSSPLSKDEQELEEEAEARKKQDRLAQLDRDFDLGESIAARMVLLKDATPADRSFLLAAVYYIIGGKESLVPGVRGLAPATLGQAKAAPTFSLSTLEDTDDVLRLDRANGGLTKTTSRKVPSVDGMLRVLGNAQQYVGAHARATARRIEGEVTASAWALLLEWMCKCSTFLRYFEQHYVTNSGVQAVPFAEITSASYTLANLRLATYLRYRLSALAADPVRFDAEDADASLWARAGQEVVQNALFTRKAAVKARDHKRALAPSTEGTAATSLRDASIKIANQERELSALKRKIKTLEGGV